MQLVAYGAQDIYLTGNPQITFFKVVYRRHTNFSMEAIEQTWNGPSKTAGRCSATISRNGDLVSRMYLEVSSDSEAANAHNPGVSWIKSVELEIGGQKIDKHSGVWMETWAELTQPNDAGCVRQSVANLIAAGDGTGFQVMSGMGGVEGASSEITTGCRYYVPLQFWFCRNPGLALPLIALQYHEVKIYLDHDITSTFNNAAASASIDNKLWADYIYLDTDERRRFAQVSHEYLIEQVQEQSLSADPSNELNFNHPVKELIWVAASKAAGVFGSCSLVATRATATSATDTWGLKLNGHDRFADRFASYFSRTQVWQHHTGRGGLNSASSGASSPLDAICVYSFALKPEEHQPSGTCNFSRIDNASLIASSGNPIVVSASCHPVCFAVNYNVLRIMSGMGGLAYSN